MATRLALALALASAVHARSALPSTRVPRAARMSRMSAGEPPLVLSDDEWR